MIIRSFEEAEKAAQQAAADSRPRKISVLGADNREFLLALKEAHRRGYAEPVLIGNEKKIRDIAGEISFDISRFRVIDEKDPQETAERGFRLVADGETDFILRGYIEGPPLYRSLIRATSREGVKRQICVLGLMQFPLLPKLIAFADIGITVDPDFKAKMQIIESAVDMFRRLGYESPQVGLVTARRGLNENLDSVADAAMIREAWAKGDLPPCSLAEGLSFSDFLLGPEGSQEESGSIDYSRVPDIIIISDLDFGNIIAKIETIAERDFSSSIRRHAFILGTGLPFVIPSRSDTHRTIITDIALGVLIS
jgi:phosphate butyryltransferase